MKPEWEKLVAVAAAAAAAAVAALLAFVMEKMAIACSGAGEFSTAVRAGGLGGLSRLLALMSQQVGKGGELTTIAAVLPASWLRSALDDPDVAGIWSARGAC